jgi:hypothetical protein
MLRGSPGLCRTLPSNLALCVNPSFQYVRARDPANGKVYVVAESRLHAVPGAVPKAKKGAKGGKAGDKKESADAEPKGWQASCFSSQKRALVQISPSCACLCCKVESTCLSDLLLDSPVLFNRSRSRNPKCM